MHNNGSRKGFKGMEEWDRRNKESGGGEVLHAKGMRYDDHSDTARKIEERKRQSEQKNNPSSSMSR